MIVRTPEQAAAIAKTHDGAGKPLIIVDYSDNPGAGTYGDATNLLKAMQPNVSPQPAPGQA